MKIEVTEISGKTVEVDMLQYPLEFGKDNFYELRYVEGDYLMECSE